VYCRILAVSNVAPSKLLLWYVIAIYYQVGIFGWLALLAATAFSMGQTG
jgi:hypothetical protein